MIFAGAFRCSKCGRHFTLDLGETWIAEHKTPKRIGAEIEVMAQLIAESCLEHEKECVGASAEVVLGRMGRRLSVRDESTMNPTYRMSLLAYHADALHPRDVEVLANIDTVITAEPSTMLPVQTIGGDVVYHVAKRMLREFRLGLTEVL